MHNVLANPVPFTPLIMHTHASGFIPGAVMGNSHIKAIAFACSAGQPVYERDTVTIFRIALSVRWFLAAPHP